MRDYPFGEKFSVSRKTSYPSITNIFEISRTLIEDYCFPYFEVIIEHFTIYIIFPKVYNINQREWIVEVFLYNLEDSRLCVIEGEKKCNNQITFKGKEQEAPKTIFRGTLL